VIFISVVIENLKEAIVGESNAKRKYELFAEKALNEGFPEIAHLFKAISTAEAIHIKNHLKAIEEITKKSVDLDAIANIEENVLKKQVRNTRNNLIQAIAGETFEFKKMYKGFMKNAKKNDVYLAEFSFDLARMAEIVHSKLYIRFLKKLCGNVELRKKPKICPNCEHDQKFFMKA
jgi:rubrerythrin